uniref:Uncharacterized protein n=1 Tax=Talaromyces marneffei PM1 TaxID=1077442 RepID=A0A093W2G1_TALMA
MADSTLYLYTSLTAGSSHIITATSRLETILKANKIPFQAIDIATDDAARRLWGRGFADVGVFKDLEQIEEWNEYGELKAEIGAVSDPNDFSSEPKKADAVEVPKPAPVVAPMSNKSSGTSTPHIQIQNPPVSENKEDQRTLALRLAGEEAAARAKENARSKLGAKPVTTEGEGKATPTSDPTAKGTESVASVKGDKEDEKKSDTDAAAISKPTDSDIETKKPTSTSDSTAGRSVVPESIPPSLKRPPLADEVAAVSSENFHADDAEVLGLVGHHRGSIVSATTQDEQEQVREDIRASISDVPADADIDALRKTAEAKKGDTIAEDEDEDSEEEEEEEEKKEDKPAETKKEVKKEEEKTQKQDPKNESKAGVSVDD